MDEFLFMVAAVGKLGTCRIGAPNRVRVRPRWADGCGCRGALAAGGKEAAWHDDDAGGADGGARTVALGLESDALVRRDVIVLVGHREGQPVQFGDLEARRGAERVEVRFEVQASIVPRSRQ
jgi:hypothetical protein